MLICGPPAPSLSGIATGASAAAAFAGVAAASLAGAASPAGAAAASLAGAAAASLAGAGAAEDSPRRRQVAVAAPSWHGSKAVPRRAASNCCLTL